MKTEINLSYEEISIDELQLLKGGVSLPIGKYSNFLLWLLGILSHDDVL